MTRGLLGKETYNVILFNLRGEESVAKIQGPRTDQSGTFRVGLNTEV